MSTEVYSLTTYLSRDAIEQAAIDVRAEADAEALRRLHDRIDADGAIAHHALPTVTTERLVPVDTQDGWLPDYLARREGNHTPWAMERRHYTLTATPQEH